MFARIRPLIVKGLVGAVVGTTAFTTYKYQTDEGTARSLQFWKKMFPVYAHYRYYQLLNRDLKWMNDEDADKKFEELHNLYSGQIRELVFTMKGFYLKQAQLMSTQDNFVPKAEWVKDTQDNVPSAFANDEAQIYVTKLLKDELGLNFDDVFCNWEHKALGVASIGQVHKAVLKSTGETVAVKILCPGIEKQFRADIKVMKDFCELAMPQHATAFNEIEKQFCTEFDYRAEAGNLKNIRDAIMPTWGARVLIPEPHTQLCSKHLLVMEYLDGVRFVDGVRQQYSKIAALRGTTVQALEDERKEKIAAGTFVFKSLEEDRVEREKMERLLAANNLFWKYNPFVILYNWSPAAYVFGRWEDQTVEVPIDLGATIELLCRVHGDELFRHGAFNGDCHPGNVMLLKDGRLGLIDYGQVKVMTTQERIVYAKLIIAHARGDKQEVIRIHFDEIGTKTKKLDKEIGYLMSCFYNDRMTADVCQGMNIANFIDYLESKDPMVQLPEAFLFAARLNILLRGVGNAFGLQLRMSKLWEADAVAFLKSQGVEY